MAKSRNSKIANVQFLLSLMVVLIHATTTNINLPDKELQSVAGMNYASFIQYFISEGICRIAVPLFFIISGFLFYRSFDGKWNTYIQKLKRRIKSLLIPYLIWSAAVFVAFTLAQRIPALKPYFTTRNDGSFSLLSFIDNVLIHTYNSPLWFCQYLLVFSVLSLPLYYLAKKLPVTVLALSFVGWLFGFRFIGITLLFRTDAVFFYLLGAVLGVKHPSAVNYRLTKAKWIVSALVWAAFLTVHTVWLCAGYSGMIYSIEEKLGIIAGIITVWFGYDLFSVKSEFKYAGCSFLLFACHHPIVNTLKKVLMKILGVSSLTSLVTYVLSACLTIGLIICFGMVVKKKLPKFFGVISGNR